MNDKDLKIVEAMEKYGGSFVNQLAKLAHRADPANLMKIKITWSEYWKRYEKMSNK